MSHLWVPGKNSLGGRNSMCKGPEARMWSECSRYSLGWTMVEDIRKGMHTHIPFMCIQTHTHTGTYVYTYICIHV